MFEALEPDDLVWRHAWLFEKPWVEESWDEIEDDVDLQARDERIGLQRRQAVKDVLSDSGQTGVLRLAFSGNAPHVVGECLAGITPDHEARLSFVRAVLRDGDLLASRRHESLISGLFDGIRPSATVSVVDALWLECERDVGLMLLRLGSFERSIWNWADAKGSTVAGDYSTNVPPRWRGHGDEDLNFAVSRLLAAGRPSAALDYAHLDWGSVESRHIQAILSSLPRSDECPHVGVRFAPSIRRALRVLGERSALTQNEMARLELLYLDLFWADEDGVPN